MTELEIESKRLEEMIHLAIIAKYDMERQLEIVNKLLDKAHALLEEQQTREAVKAARLCI